MAVAEVLKLRVKGWDKMAFELSLYERFLVCCNRTVESEFFLSFLKCWKQDKMWFVSH